MSYQLKHKAPALKAPALIMAVALAAAACSGSDDKPDAASTPSSPSPAATSTDPAQRYAAGRSTPVRDPYYPQHGDPSIDVLHYGLDLDWAPDKRTLTGTATLAVRAAAATDTLRLDFGKPMKIDDVTLDGKTVTADHSGDVLKVPAGRKLKRDATTTLVVKYHGTPQETKGPAERKDSQRLGFQMGDGGSAVALQEPFGAFTWYPANDQPSDKALYDVAITVPQGWSGISSGTFTGKTGDTYHWQSASPTASYLVTFAADKFEMIKDTGPNGLPLTYWVLPKDKDRELKVLRKSPAIIKWLENRLGPYPFPSGGAVIAGDSGMETQQMITVMPGLPDNVYAHEYAHQWFGDAVTPKTWPDLWLNEGFAMYFEFIYQAENAGAGPAALDAFMKRITDQADAQLRRNYGPPGHFDKNKFGSENAYLNPAIMIHKIRRKVGDEKFFGMLRGWIQEHRGTNQDRAAFTAYAEQKTGTKLKPLIDEWLDSTTTPRD
ncbi:M1 family metallopeptidase [Actinomadura barringtoniae]|uniref:Aminopeptidase N n=1 Tax=Actinomadura barringtoniae TaxID=1427535 RepID=A0A939TCC6_9ACTN|nr:M1 family metallopeptidase [Actinomadura barringtoniae]MBO2454432.1 M1 family metallopeptidase [Actinomadura barringtoniae]